MNKSLSYPLLFFFVGLAIYVTPVHAEGAVDISSFPQYLADQLGMSLFAGQLMASAIFISLFLFPMGLILRKSGMVLLIMLFILMGVCVALSWLPVFFIILSILGCIGTLSMTFRKWLS